MIQNHVPKAEGGAYANAQERLEKNPGDLVNGMFTDFATAEKVTAALIHEHQKEYDAWLKNPNATEKLVLRGKTETPIGEVAKRNRDGTFETTPGHSVKIVLVKARVHGDCFVETAYPENAR